jgi:uncharacterized protein DUF4412
MKKVFVFLCLGWLISSNASAELKYTLKTEVQKPEKPASPAPNPMVAMMGDALTRQLLPEGTATMTYVIGDKGTRIEFVNAAMGQPAGTVTLVQPDGTTVLMNPKEQTYWKTGLQGAAAAIQAAGITPQVTSAATGEAETVAGVKCERSTFTMKMDLPIPASARASLGADFPSSIDMSGDTCATTDQFQSYAAMAAKTQATGMLAALGLDKLTQGGIVLRQSLKMGAVEIRSAVTDIGEGPAPEGAFEIPAGYKEVPPPTAPR